MHDQPCCASTCPAHTSDSCFSPPHRLLACLCAHERISELAFPSYHSISWGFDVSACGFDLNDSAYAYGGSIVAAERHLRFLSVVPHGPVGPCSMRKVACLPAGAIWFSAAVALFSAGGSTYTTTSLASMGVRSRASSPSCRMACWVHGVCKNK